MTRSFTTPSEMRAAFDALLAATARELRLYAGDLEAFDVDRPERHAALRALCLTGGSRRIEMLLDSVDAVRCAHPRLMGLLRDFGHVIEVRQADPDAPRPDKSFAIADRRRVLLRPDKFSPAGSLEMDDAAGAARLVGVFDGLWQRAPLTVGATTLGL